MESDISCSPDITELKITQFFELDDIFGFWQDVHLSGHKQAELRRFYANLVDSQFKIVLQYYLNNKMKTELNNLKEYLLSKSSEDAKRPLVYPFFKKLFGKNFKVESDAEGADGYLNIFPKPPYRVIVKNRYP